MLAAVAGSPSIVDRADEARWVRRQGDTVHVDGAGYAVGPRNVVVVVTEYRASPADPRSPEALTVGDGEALILTDGRLVRGRWARAEESDPMSFVDESGEPVALTEGRTWLELVEPGTAEVLA